LVAESPFPPDAVDGPVAGRGRDPRARVVGDAVPGPPIHGRDEGFLNRFFGKVEVAHSADEGGERPSLFLPEQALDDLANVCVCAYEPPPGAPSTGMTSWTSTAPNRTSGSFAAASRASFSEHSSM